MRDKIIMPAADFRRFVNERNWTITETALRFGRDRHTIRRWCKFGAPQSAYVLIEAWRQIDRKAAP